jgi:hypothetical protein
MPTQQGSWSVIGEGIDKRGQFQLTDEGAVVLEDRELDMDHGAIDLIARITKFAGAIA